LGSDQFDGTEREEKTSTSCSDSKKSKTGDASKVHDSKILKKYWAQRYRLFSRFDSGIKLDEGNIHVLIQVNDF